MLAFGWAVLIHGDVTIPELGSGCGWRPLGAIGMRCPEMGVTLGCTEKQLKRTNPISDAVGKFFFSMGDSGLRVMTNDSDIPSIAISKIRDSPWIWPTRLGGDEPINIRQVIRALGGMDFRTLPKGYEISDHIVTDVEKHTHHPLYGTGFFSITSNYPCMESSEENPPIRGTITLWSPS